MDNSRSIYFCGKGDGKWTYDPSSRSQLNLTCVFLRIFIARQYAMHADRARYFLSVSASNAGSPVLRLNECTYRQTFLAFW